MEIRKSPRGTRETLYLVDSFDKQTKKKTHPNNNIFKYVEYIIVNNVLFLDGEVLRKQSERG